MTNRTGTLLFVANIALLLTSLLCASILSSLSVLMFSVFMQCLALLVIGKYPNKDVVKYVYLTLIIGTLFVLFVYQSSLMENGIPYYSLEFNDDQKFELYAEEFNTLGVSFLEYPSVSRYGKIRYPFYMGIISILMDFGSLFDGYHTFMPRLLNIYLLAVSLLMVDSIVRIEYSFSQKQMKCLFLTLSLFPNLYYIAGFTFRDTVCLFLGLCTVWASVNLIDNRHSKLFLYVVIFSSLVFQYHVRAMATLVFFVISGLYLADHMAIRYGKKIFVVYAMASMLLFVISFRTLASEVGWYVSNYDQYRGGSGNRLLRIPLLPFGVFVRGIYGFFLPSPSFYVITESSGILHKLIQIARGVGTLYIIIQIPGLLRVLIKPDKMVIAFALTYAVYLTSMTFRHVILMYPYLFILVSRSQAESKLAFNRVSRTIYILLVIIAYFSFSWFRL